MEKGEVHYSLLRHAADDTDEEDEHVVILNTSRIKRRPDRNKNGNKITNCCKSNSISLEKKSFLFVCHTFFC